MRNVGVGEFFVNVGDPVGPRLFGRFFDGRQKHENLFLHNVQSVRRKFRLGFLSSDKVRENVQEFRVHHFAEHAAVLLRKLNYLRSSYCQREKLWWARREIKLGRLNKDTRPIYYVKLPEVPDEETNELIRELKTCQAQPFFVSPQNATLRKIKKRLDSIKNDIKTRVHEYDKGSCSVCTVGKFNEFFAGRLLDLSRLHELCQENGAIPVLYGDPGIGKSDLAITYAHAYAEDFPEGRFFIPMQGVDNWHTAMIKLAEQLKICGFKPVEVGLPDKWDKLPENEKFNAVWDWLKARAHKGQLLLLLDNLEKLELLDQVPNRWSNKRNEELPIRIIATTRLYQLPPSERSRRRLLRVGRLTQKDALELFCLIGGNVFPFANWPFSTDGRLLLDNLPPEKRPPQNEVHEIEKEFAALNDIIEDLQGHPWSLEIVAGFMAKSKGYSFQEKHEALQANPLVTGKISKGDVQELRNPEILLQPTFDQLRDFNRIAEKLGDNILWLAQAAAFFPPEQVPLNALKGIWEQEFGDAEVDLDGGAGKAHTGFLAIDALRQYRIITGDGAILEMHRLTRGVLCKQCENEPSALLDAMGRYLKSFLIDTGLPSEAQLIPWCGWAENWFDHPALREDENFWDAIIELAAKCYENWLLRDAKKLFDRALAYAEKQDAKFMMAECHQLLGRICADLLCPNDAANEFRKVKEIALESMYKKDFADYLLGRGPIERALAYSRLEQQYKNGDYLKAAVQELEDALEKNVEWEKDPQQRIFNIAIIHNTLGAIYIESESFDLAEKEFSLFLAGNDSASPETLKLLESVVAAVYLNRGLAYHHLENFEPAERDFNEALIRYENLAKQNHDAYDQFVARTYSALGTLFGKQAERENSERYIKLAEKNYHEALRICKSLEERFPKMYAQNIADTFTNLGALFQHYDLDKALCQFRQVIEIYRPLADSNPNIFKCKLADAYINMGVAHGKKGDFDSALREYTSAMEIYQDLAKNEPDQEWVDFRIASLHVILGGSYLSRGVICCHSADFGNAKAEYRQALEEYQRLADKYQLDVEITDAHYGFGVSCFYLGEWPMALKETQQALEEYQKNPEKFEAQIALSHYYLGSIHIDFKDPGWVEVAENELQLALDQFRALKNVKTFSRNIANTLHLLGQLHARYLGQRIRGGGEHLEALEIRWGRPVTVRDMWSLKEWRIMRNWFKPRRGDVWRLPDDY